MENDQLQTECLMAARILVKSQCILLLVKEIRVVKNATADTQDLYRYLTGDRA